MSHKLKVIRIRWCVQCEGPIPSRCEKCKIHPGRKPRVVELYGVPEVIRTAECGCCVLLRCQRPNCPKTMWRPKKDLNKLKNHVCGVVCRQIILSVGRRTAMDVPCSMPGCGKVIRKHQCTVKYRTHVYCSQKCHYAHRAVVASEKRRSEEDGDIQSLTCDSGRCRGEVRDHTRQRSGMMSCTYCHSRRTDEVVLVKGAPSRILTAAVGR